jgi:hypothetical protein
MDTAEYQEFMKYQQFKLMLKAAEMPQPPSSPPPADAPPPPAAPPPARAPFKIDWERQMNFLMMQMKPYRGDGWSAHPNLFQLFCEIFKEFPERFRLIGELHAADDGRNYFSFSYEKPGVPYGRVTFHVYGRLSGTKFINESVDIKFGKTEEYFNAAKFNTSHHP